MHRAGAGQLAARQHEYLTLLLEQTIFLITENKIIATKPLTVPEFIFMSYLYLR